MSEVSTLTEQEQTVLDYLCGKPADMLLEMYYANIFFHNRSNSVELFNLLLNGKIDQVQQFTEVGAHRRVYCKFADDDLEKKNPSLYVKSNDGKEEKWHISKINIHKGQWVGIPSSEYHVSYGIALDALLKGKCDYIRSESWADQNLYIRKSDRLKDYLHYDSLMTVNTNTTFLPSMTAQIQNDWIMVKLPEKINVVQKNKK